MRYSRASERLTSARTTLFADFTSPIRRYADVLAHRQLSAAIGYTALHSSLSNKSHVERIMTNVNKRHRLAQQAGRASVEFYVGLALKGRSQKGGKTVEVREEAFVIRCFKNGVAVYVHKSVLPFTLSRCRKSADSTIGSALAGSASKASSRLTRTSTRLNPRASASPCPLRPLRPTLPRASRSSSPSLTR